jgi:glycerol kinase
MAWLRRRLGGALSRTTAITTIDAWTNFRLTGRFATDAATASRTMLLDPETLDWSPEAIAAFGLEELPMPEVIACDARLGTTSAFGPSIAVIGAIVDQQAALLAEGCLAEGDAKCTYGTGAFLLANVGTRHAPSAAGLATSLAWAMSNGDRASCVDGQVYTVGAAVSWLERIGLIDSPADLDRLGGSVASTGGVICVPALAGVGAPTWRPDARATWQGLSLATSREHMVRAFCEGVAAQVALLAAAAADDIGAPLASLRVDGGLTRSRVVMQLQADLLGVPVEVYPHTCATALGVAALALRGLEGPGAEDDLIKGWGPAATYVPTVSADEASARVRAFAAALEAS